MWGLLQFMQPYNLIPVMYYVIHNATMYMQHTKINH